MYPLNLMKPAKGNDQAGFACANDEAEHMALSDAGYEPAFAAPEEPEATDEPEAAPKKRGRPAKTAD